MRRLMDKKKGKKGAAHFEMIFSFVFFVGFVFFLFVVLKPQDTSTLSGSVIEALYDSFREEVTTNLSTTFLKANYTGGKTCFNITLPGRIFRYAIVSGKSHVTNLSGGKVDSDLVASGGAGDLEIYNDDAGFYRVSLSPEFSDNSLSNCGNLSDYELGNVLERKVVSYKALQNMSNEYNFGDYEGLRSRLKIPPIFDFSIMTESMPDLNMEPESDIPGSVEIQAQDYVIEVLRDTGELTNERFTLKIW